MMANASGSRRMLLQRGSRMTVGSAAELIPDLGGRLAKLCQHQGWLGRLRRLFHPTASTATTASTGWAGFPHRLAHLALELLEVVLEQLCEPQGLAVVAGGVFPG